MIFPGYHMPMDTPKERKARAAAFEKWAAAEAERVARQRAAFAANLGPARAGVEKLMCDRAWELLDGGELEAADALLEFIPQPVAEQLLQDFFGDQT